MGAHHYQTLIGPCRARVEVLQWREKQVSVTTSSDPIASDNSGNNEFEGGIREFVRKDVALGRKRQERPEPPADTHENVSMLVQRVACASISEIDNLIEELRTMREFLRNEGERVQREIAGYASASQTSAASTKEIAESMARWRSAFVATPPFRS